MRRLGLATRPVLALAAAALLIGGSGAPPARAAETTPDRSEVVLVLDFSASILNDATNRRRFAAALERIADRVDATAADLTAGDATVSIVRFATRAIDDQGCVDLRLLGSADAVGQLADCLRSVAGDYRAGLTTGLTERIGIDTNYVAAMERAAGHLPADAVRPALILFTDGKHDVAGVPVSGVAEARDRLFGDRSPFALLPVGMGLDPAERDTLATGLEDLQITRDMPACVSGTVFDWPQVVFETADEAGNAVASALQAATCTFTVAPTPSPPPATPSPEPTLGAVTDVRLTPSEGRIDVSWTAPGDSATIADYRVRCGLGDDEWIESAEGVSLETTAGVEGLTDGLEYRCEVAVVRESGEGEWTAAAATAIPTGLPAAPGKPSVVARDRALEVSVEPGAPGVTGFRYECSDDDGTTWDEAVEVVAVQAPTAQVRNLSNGTAYVCRAFATNAGGASPASPLSDAVNPCGSLLDCNPLVRMGLIAFGLALGGVILLLLFLMFRDRTRGYVLAVVDVVHTANLGHGSRLGIELVRAPGSRNVTGIVAEKGPTADFRIRALSGGRFEVRDRTGRHVASSGESIVVVDSAGIRHELVLRAFDTNAASQVASRR